MEHARAFKTESFAKVFVDKNIYKKLAPKILLEGEPVDFFFPSTKVPNQFTPTIMEHDGKEVYIGLKMSHEDAAAAADKNWQIEFSVDARISAVVSLLKAAHLTLFEILGYRYALSAAGGFLGRQILGEFFLNNVDKPREDVAKNAWSFFAEFINMVKPITASALTLAGTVTDKKIFLCRAGSGFFWAFIVFVKTGDILHAVMVPVWDRIDLIPTFFDFLRNKNSRIVVSAGQYQQDHWIIQKEEIPVTWPKAEDLGT